VDVLKYGALIIPFLFSVPFFWCCYAFRFASFGFVLSRSIRFASPRPCFAPISIPLTWEDRLHLIWIEDREGHLWVWTEDMGSRAIVFQSRLIGVLNADNLFSCPLPLFHHPPIFSFPSHSPFWRNADADALYHPDWPRWVLKGHKGFVLTKDEVDNGISAEQFTAGLDQHEDGQWYWDNEVLANARVNRPVPFLVAGPLPGDAGVEEVVVSISAAPSGTGKNGKRKRKRSVEVKQEMVEQCLRDVAFEQDGAQVDVDVAYTPVVSSAASVATAVVSPPAVTTTTVVAPPAALTTTPVVPPAASSSTSTSAVVPAAPAPSVPVFASPLVPPPAQGPATVQAPVSLAPSLSIRALHPQRLFQLRLLAIHHRRLQRKTRLSPIPTRIRHHC
jgi:hypothetical protein